MLYEYRNVREMFQEEAVSCLTQLPHFSPASVGLTLVLSERGSSFFSTVKSNRSVETYFSNIGQDCLSKKI